MKKRTLAIALTALGLAALPAGAQASIVHLDPGDDEGDDARITFIAFPGEANRLSVSSPTSTAAIEDSGATITPGRNCTAVTPNRVTCGVGGQLIGFAEIELGDGDDTSQVTGVASFTKGGTGDDQLTGSEVFDNLDGGGGADRLLGGDGDDSLTDGDATGTANADELNGGDGDDSVRYVSRTAPVTLNLAAPGPGGETGEGDLVTSIENAVSGSGDDTLTGGGGRSALAGGAGRDTVDGAGGDDLIQGGAGNDLLIGGAGRDELYDEAGNDVNRLDNPPGQFDRLVACGAGKDRVEGVGPSPSLPITCETGAFGSGFVARLQPVSYGRSSVTLKLPCPEAFRRDGRCKGNLAVEPKAAYLRSTSTRKRARYGLASFRLPATGGRVTVPLSRAGRGQIAKRSFKLQFEVKLRDAATGITQRFTWTALIVRPQ